MNGKQLKNSILQWAIQGKLVPQDPNEEPASVLLERIREEKARLVKEKKIKKDKNESIIFRGDDNSHYEKFADGTVKCIDDEIPFEIPQSWCWVRLNELGFYRKGPFGSSLTKDMFVPYSKSAIKVYEQKNAIQKDYRLGHYYISDTKFNQMQSFVTNPGDIIVSCAGTIGETYQLPDDAPIGIINQALMRVCLYDKSISDYWQMSFDYILLVNSEMKGAGSAIKNIPPFDVLKSLLVPIPPIAEQNRILSQYRILQSKIRAFETLNSDLERLNSTIFEKLKKSVLQEAIQGKLVPQDPNDETASVLLERIKEEKAKLFKQGKLKKKDLVDSVIFKGEDNKYYETINGITTPIESVFDYPDSWEVMRLHSICLLSDGEKKTGPQVCLDAKYLRGKASATLLLQGKFVKKGDNIILVDGENSGEVFTVPIDGYMGSTFKQLWISRCLYLPYILAFIRYYKDELRNSKKGAAIPHLNKEIFYNLLIGIPPYEEQIRIVESVEQLSTHIVKL